MSTPSLAIITLCKDDPDDFISTANSILSQDLSSFSWIICDSSPLENYELIKEYLSTTTINFSILRCPPTGIYSSLNLGINRARKLSCSHLLVLNSGDYLGSSSALSSAMSYLSEVNSYFIGQHA